MKGSKFCREEEKILIEAEKIKFGQGIYASQDKESFMDGVIFVVSRLEGGNEALKARGYNA